MKLLKLKNITRNYTNVYGIFDINMTINKGEFVLLTGPSGAGKTTLLKMIYLGEKPDKGLVILDGISSKRVTSNKIAKLRRKCGIIFQDFKLFHDRTVFQNLEFILRVTGCPRKLIKSKIIKVLLRVGLQAKTHEKPEVLSGGEQQRVAIARAIINEPKIILADEPFRNLDWETANEIFELLLKINQNGTAVILTTHDKSILGRNVFREIILDEGRIIEDYNGFTD